MLGNRLVREQIFPTHVGVKPRAQVISIKDHNIPYARRGETSKKEAENYIS